jgi:hypothetical protein
MADAIHTTDQTGKNFYHVAQFHCCPKNKILNETKKHNPPLQVKWSVPKDK